MNKYAKIGKDGQLEYAPANKGNIINYNTNIELLKKDGFLELIEIDFPLDGKNYNISYKEQNGKIIKTFTEAIMVKSYRELRENELPSVGDVVDAICKALDGDRTEFDELNSLRLSIKDKYPKPKETSEQSEVSSFIKEE